MVDGSGEVLVHISLRVEASPSDEISIERWYSPINFQKGKEGSWFRRGLDGYMSSETKVSEAGCGGLVRRRRSIRGEPTRGVLTVQIFTPVLYPASSTRVSSSGTGRSLRLGRGPFSLFGLRPLICVARWFMGFL